MKKSSPARRRVSRDPRRPFVRPSEKGRSGDGWDGRIRTDDETLHLVLAQDLHPEDLLHAVVVLVRAPAGRHDAQLRRARAAQLLLLALQQTDELQAVLDPVRLELHEVQPPARLLRVGLAGEVDELRQGAADLQSNVNARNSWAGGGRGGLRQWRHGSRRRCDGAAGCRGCR